jgi:chemotaxis protein MotB
MSAHGGGGDRWLVSYADFITLLMVLFVVLYSMGQTDIKKYKRLADSLKSAFSGGTSRVVDPQIDSTSGSETTNAAPAPIVVEGLPMTSSTGVEVASDLSNMLEQAGLDSDVSIQNSVEGVLISLSEKLLFGPGTADLIPEAYPILDKIVEMLKPIPNDVRIVGHTDDSPPIDNRFANNWDLSYARAMVIVNYFVDHGVSSNRLIPTGRGSYQPVFPNDTAEHRALNSRADIVVVYYDEVDVINSNLP